MTRKQMMWTACAVISTFALGCATDTETQPMDTEDAPDGGDGGDSESAADTESESATDTDSQAMNDDIYIIGAYTTDFGASITVTNTEWKDETTFGDLTYASNYAITFFDNEASYIIAQNSADNTYNPELWSRFDWTLSTDIIYYCQSVYDAESEAVAKASGDASDPLNLETGCSGFAWSQLIPN